MRNIIPLVKVVDLNGVVTDLVLNVKLAKIEADEEGVVEQFISPDEFHAVGQWYVTAWATHLMVTSRAKKEKPTIKVGNLLEFSRDFTPHGTTSVIKHGTLCRVMFPPRKVGYGLAPSTVRVRVHDDFITVPLHYLTTIWAPINPDDAQMTASRKWNGKQPVGQDIAEMWSPLVSVYESMVDQMRSAKAYASGKQSTHPASCTQPSQV